MASFGRDLGWAGQPFEWSPVRRGILRAELDAAFMHLYGVERSDVERICDSFWIIRDRDLKEAGTYRTKQLVLEAYDAMSTASSAAPFVSRLEPLPGDPGAAHGPRSGEPHGRWLPWRAGRVPRRAPSQPPASPSAGSLVFPATPVPARRVAEWSAGLSTEQQTMDGLSQAGTAGWISESKMEPHDILMGARVRHRSRGTGTVLTVKAGPKSCEILISFVKKFKKVFIG